MAQPQGLNVPAIVVTAIITIVLVGTIIEGVRAYEIRTEGQVEARRWQEAGPTPPMQIKIAQEKAIEFETSIPIAEAMKRTVQSGGKLPATQPAAQ